MFSGAGCQTRVYDKDTSQMERSLEWFETTLSQDVEDGFLSADEAQKKRALVTMHADMQSALDGAFYIQESTSEEIKVKQLVFSEIDHIAPPTAIIASSSSGLDINRIAAGLPGISRYSTAT